MDINYEKRYAYAEVWAILDHLGDDYKRKVPKNLLRLFKEERKFGYVPEIDFGKPLEDQVRQETKNYIAYLYYYCWETDENKKARLVETIKQNAEKKKSQDRLEKQKNAEIHNRNVRVGLNAQLDDAIKNLNKK